MPEDIYPINNGDRICDQFRNTNWHAGVMISVLRQYFGSDERISLDKGRFLWNPDITSSGIQIDVVDNLKYAEGNKHPKILVDIEDQTFNHDVLGDLGDYTGQTGTREFMNQNASAYSIECWGLFKLEAASIADEVRYFLQAYRHEISQKYQFKFLRVTKMLKPVKYKIFKEYWICRLIVALQTEERWGVTQESLRASQFFLDLNAQS